MSDDQFVNKRIDSIYEYLKAHRRASITELAQTLYTSESTIRRDLAEMQQKGLIARYHGGAMLRDGTDELSIFVRLERDADRKERTARLALGRLPAFDSVFIDNSTTCLALARMLDLQNKMVVTNGLQLALQLSRKKDVHTVIPGGAVQFGASATAGSLTTRMMQMFAFDLMLMSCAAMNERGIYERSLETTQLKQIVMERSKHKVLIADASKLDTDAAYRIAGPEVLDEIITDAPDDKIDALRRSGVTVFNTPAPARGKWD